MALSPLDPNSFSRPELAIVTHTHLNLDVDFDNHILKGYAILDIERKAPSAHDVVLDVRGLVLLSIVNLIDSSKLQFNQTDSVEYGSKLNVNLPTVPVSESEQNKFKIKIEYETSPNATGLQWLSAQQTAGGVHPYLFSQCEPIHCRSMLPCQDTPYVKSTYSAEIQAPAELWVLMSGLRNGTERQEGLKKIHTFYQPIPIASYLIAIAVGAFVSKDIGPRSKVWTEKEYIEAGAYEFAETESMIKTAEELCGPYIWGQYDLLILPPSFPFGGMENPCLTFVTPTLLAGDRSLANVVAHEIAHSWTGNLVTNANFEHFWLNEGFTVFLERKIKGRMANESVRQFEALHGLQSLNSTLRSMAETPEFTKLIPNLIGINPDTVYSPIPYEKGHLFLFVLEELLGGPKEFEPFLKSYLDKFKFKSIVTKDFQEYLYSYFAKKKQILDSVDWNTWLYAPGAPPVIPNYDKSLANVYLQLAERWIKSIGKSSSEFSENDIAGMTSNQKASFLADLVLRNKTLTIDQLKLMQQIYKFNLTQNADIKSSWLRLCLKSRWEDKVDEALLYVTTQGRLKYARPIFQEFYKWEKMRPKAIEAFMKNKEKMMYITRNGIAKDLHLIDPKTK